jgi:hypothetical protein
VNWRMGISLLVFHTRISAYPMPSVRRAVAPRLRRERGEATKGPSSGRCAMGRRAAVTWPECNRARWGPIP